jgi:hypothetical protein
MMKVIFKILMTVVLLQLFANQAHAVTVETRDYRSMTSDLAARKIEAMLNWFMSNRGIPFYEISYISESGSDGQSCAPNTPQQLTVDSPEQVIALVNSMPIADIRFDISGQEAGGIDRQWLVLVSKAIADPVASSNYYKDYSAESYASAKDRFVNSMLGWYETNVDVDHYQIQYKELTSGVTKTITVASNTDLNAVLDQLAAGSYQFNVNVVYASGTISSRLVQLSKAASDVQPISQNIQLAWQQPTAREDGATLTAADIASYEIYYTSIAADNSSTDNVITVNNGATTQFVLQNVPTGEYFFAVAAVDSNGLKSNMSDIVTTIVN